MKPLNRILLLAVLSGGAMGARAQSIPDTEIFLIPLKKKQEIVQVGKPVNISNRPGYDNQPSFSPDGRSVLYTSQRDGQQTDIYRYLIKGKKTEQLTATPENEYSPLVTPDGKSFSVVRGKEQDLWRFPLTPGATPPSLVLDFPQLVGYHVWYNQDSLLIAAFPDKPPMAMYLVAPGDRAADPVEASIGRSLHKVPGKPALSYLVPVSDSLGEIKQWNLKTGQREKLIQALPGSQDYAWLPDGRLLMAQGAKIFLYRPGTDPQWKQIADLTAHGIKNITRLAISPKGDFLSLVANQ